MGSVKVTVYGRIKPCYRSAQEYKVKYGDEEDQISFNHSRVPSRRSFRFKKIFGEDATQEEVFETVAKPMIKNFFAGFNGTIFTYGQTGSGKTYTMTGDIEEWLNPGLIPRTIEEVFKIKGDDTTVTITFCEIYNEHIYDLIRTDRPDSEPAAVSMVTEANTGITNFRNLSTHTVKTADEALQLFLRGDANKMVAETGSNFRSSRSHAIFSLGLEFPHPTEENLRLKPVLYLVDLAGSEKLSKCKTPMSNVSETRYINLSLHYLEQVLIALRQPGRAHIPYRNSLMTALLRNSLGGNSITIMIATFSVAREDAEETTQTCRFAERIALIKNEVKLIELVNPEKEIDYLKKENERLRAQLKLVGNEQMIDQLDEKDKEKCIEAVRNFIQDNDYFELPLTNIRRMEYCFRIMRDEIVKDRDFIEYKDVKSKESQLEVKDAKSVRNIKSTMKINNDDSPLKMLQNKKSSVNILKKKKLTEIPKVNIIFEDTDFKDNSEGKENYVPKCNKEISTNKLKPVNINNQNVEVSKVKNSTEPNQISPQKKDCSNICHTLKEKDFGNKKNIEDSTSKLELQNEKIERIHLPTPRFPSATIVSTALLTEDFKGKDFRVKGEMIPTKKEINSKTESEFLNKEIPSVASMISNDFKAFTAKCVPLTGDKEVDEEIIKFYRSRYQIFKNK